MASEELFSQLSLWLVNLCCKSYIFCLNIFTCVNRDPCWEYGSGSTKFLNTDPQHCILLLPFACLQRTGRCSWCGRWGARTGACSTPWRSSRRPTLSKRRKPPSTPEQRDRSRTSCNYHAHPFTLCTVIYCITSLNVSVILFSLIKMSIHCQKLLCLGLSVSVILVFSLIKMSIHCEQLLCLGLSVSVILFSLIKMSIHCPQLLCLGLSVSVILLFSLIKMSIICQQLLCLGLSVSVILFSLITMSIHCPQLLCLGLSVFLHLALLSHRVQSLMQFLDHVQNF